MRLLILTSSTTGIASRVLPILVRNDNLSVVRVILAHGVSSNRKRKLKRKLIKTLKIGPLGALNGIRMRKWYSDSESEDLKSLCASLEIELFETPFINCDQTKDLFREANADLGLSLGNGYIAKSVFSIPKFGMINIHNEILPRFQGAQSIIWPIHECIRETGFTIHQIDSKIDNGHILYQEKYPIAFCPTLHETVETNLAESRRRIPGAVSYVCENYEDLAKNAIPQTLGNTFTTPSLRQFRRMVKNNRAFYEECINNRDAKRP